MYVPVYVGVSAAMCVRARVCVQSGGGGTCVRVRART